ncbi:MAG: hypothetical protein KDB03_21355 [Planctomycetales bacterium]|nr:hypothetical protein [Planctomycetales bacterium]
MATDLGMDMGQALVLEFHDMACQVIPSATLLTPDHMDIVGQLIRQDTTIPIHE